MPKNILKDFTKSYPHPDNFTYENFYFERFAL